MVKLTEEQRAALRQHPDGIPCEDTVTQRIYFLVDAEVHRRAMEALQRQEDEDKAAIERGLADADAGRTMTLEESQARTDAALSRLSE
jgi:predicted transcriptional regulator